MDPAEPVVLMGECGTGKPPLATGLCVAACRQKRRARFTTAANLVNELVEARQQNAVKRVLVRWLRYDVIVLDEVGYVPLAEIGAEFLFQVIAERAERAALIVTTTCRSRNGRRCFRIRACAKPSWIASPTGRTSSRPEPSLIVSAERWRYGRKRKSRSFQSFYRAKSRGRDSGRRPFLGAPSRLSSDRTGGSVISTLEEKDSYDVGGAKSDGHGGAESSCQKQCVNAASLNEASEFSVQRCCEKKGVAVFEFKLGDVDLAIGFAQSRKNCVLIRGIQMNEK